MPTASGKTRSGNCYGHRTDGVEPVPLIEDLRDEIVGVGEPA